IGKNRHTLAPIGTEETGVSAAADRLKTQVRNSYEEANVIATNKGLALPIPSGQVADLQREADDFLELTIKHSASPAERRLANNLAELGGPVHIAKDTGEIVHVGALKRESVPYRELRDLHSLMGNAALSPQEYPVSTSIGRNSF